MNKLPQLTVAFWIMKICATTLGETAGDLLSMTLGAGYGVSSLLFLFLLVGTLLLQLRSKKYHPVRYWSVILMTSTAGTTMSDFMDRTLALGYPIGSVILAGSLLSTLFVWRTFEPTLSVTTIRSLRAESFYWTAILFSNTLGTALGDFLADSSGLGFSGGALLIASLLFLVVLGYRFTPLSRIALFWMGFVLTRPFGATLGDLLTKAASQGGFGFGTIGSSVFLFVLLALFIIGSSCRRVKSPAPER